MNVWSQGGHLCFSAWNTSTAETLSDKRSSNTFTGAWLQPEGKVFCHVITVSDVFLFYLTSKPWSEHSPVPSDNTVVCKAHVPWGSKMIIWQGWVPNSVLLREPTELRWYYRAANYVKLMCKNWPPVELLGGEAYHQLTVANCILFMTLATVCLLAKLAVQLAGELWVHH